MTIDNLKKGMEQGYTELEIQRYKIIMKSSSKAFGSIFLNSNYKLKDTSEAMEVCATFASIQREQFEYASSNEFLSFFYQNSNKWLLLSHVFFKNIVGSITYKESLIKIMNASSKTVHSYISEALKRGLFINMAPSLEILKDNKIVNIRPSTDVSIAFIEFNSFVAKKNFDLIIKFGDIKKIQSSLKK